MPEVDRAETGDALRLAMARQYIASRARVTPAPAWEALTEYQRERAITEVRHWLRAADNCGLTRRHGPSAADLHERLRLVALAMHGLDGYADACEDSGDQQGAGMVRDMVAEVRALLPESADPAELVIEWAARFTAVTGRQFLYPAACEGEAREALAPYSPAGAPAGWSLMRRTVGPWVEVPTNFESSPASANETGGCVGSSDA